MWYVIAVRSQENSANIWDISKVWLCIKETDSNTVAVNVWFLVCKVSKSGFILRSSFSSPSYQTLGVKKTNPKCLLKWQPACPWPWSFWNHAEHLIKGLSITVGFLPEICMWRVMASLKELLFSFTLKNDSFWRENFANCPCLY